MRIGLVVSGTFLSDGLSAEFGKIPPCLLPLGSRTLIHRQLSEIRNAVDALYVSLPIGYALNVAEQKQFEELGAHIIYTDPALTIGAAVATCIKEIGCRDEELLVLYGDTLIAGVDDYKTDTVSVHTSWGEYRWADLTTILGKTDEEFQDKTLSGLFIFSSSSEILKCIEANEGDFLKAITLYNDSRSLELETSGEWYDFGHVQTYFRSSGLATTQRDFNDLEISRFKVSKFSKNSQKVASEAEWFTTIPSHMSFYTPAYLGTEEKGTSAGYALANTYLSTIGNLAVFGHLGQGTWTSIFSACHQFLEDCRNVQPSITFDIDSQLYFGAKTRGRIAELAETPQAAILHQIQQLNGRKLPRIDEVLEVTDEVIGGFDHGPPCMIHGDFCFSNIFFDFRSGTIRVIDPRGELPDGTRSIYGLQSYDVAKIAHSVLGGYDLIIAGYAQANLAGHSLEFQSPCQSGSRWMHIKNAFEGSPLAMRYPEPVLNAMLVHLFLSMLPLHYDRPERQLAMIATAFNLFFRVVD